MTKLGVPQPRADTPVAIASVLLPGLRSVRWLLAVLVVVGLPVSGILFVSDWSGGVVILTWLLIVVGYLGLVSTWRLELYPHGAIVCVRAFNHRTIHVTEVRSVRTRWWAAGTVIRLSRGWIIVQSWVRGLQPFIDRLKTINPAIDGTVSSKSIAVDHDWPWDGYEEDDAVGRKDDGRSSR